MSDKEKKQKQNDKQQKPSSPAGKNIAEENVEKLTKNMKKITVTEEQGKSSPSTSSGKQSKKENQQKVVVDAQSKSLPSTSSGMQPEKENEQKMKSTPSASKNPKRVKDLQILKQNTKDFMENFNPETSARERRKLDRKLNAAFPQPQPQKSSGSLYDERGIHVATGKDLCDCLIEECSGCFYPCSECKSTKCGNECRVNRKYVYEQIEYEGTNIVIKNPLLKK